MGTYIRKALLLDGETLYGVSERQGRAVPADSPELDFHEWSCAAQEPVGEGDGGANEGATQEKGVSARAAAFSAAVKDLAIEDGVPLALPPDVLVTRVLSLPAADAESLASMVRLKMEKLAPVADDDLEVDYEVVGVTESETRVFAVAVPVSTLDALAADLEASGLAVTRIDSSLLCEWHSLSRDDATADDGGSGDEAPASGPGNRMFAIELPSGRIDLIAADNRGPVFARTLGTGLSPEDFAREITLSLLDIAAETDFAPDAFTLVSPDGAASRYAEAAARAAGRAPAFKTPDEIMPFVEAALEREDEEGCIDIVPSAWREEEQASATKRKFIIGAIAAVAVWVVAFAALKAIPGAIERQTAAIRREIAALMPRYSEVAELRTRVRLIQSYEDRSRSALEMLRELCSVLPEGTTLATFAYDRTDDGGGRARGPGGIRITGDAAASDQILRLKDALDGSGVFDTARLKGPTMDGQRRRYKFELDWRFAEGGE